MKNIFSSIVVGSDNPVRVNRTEELNYWINAIKNKPMLTEEQEVELGHKIQSSPKDCNGKPTDRESVNALVEGNLRFVVSVAKQYAYASDSLTVTDLINEGNIGMIEAAETFDPTRGFKFISYAVNYVRMYVINALTYKSRIVSDYHQGVSNHYTSLDAPMADDTDTTIGDVLCTTTDAEVCANESLNSDLMRVLNAILKPEEIAIICESFGIGVPQLKRWEIAEKRNMSVENARLIEQRSLYKLRNNPQGLSILSKYLS